MNDKKYKFDTGRQRKTGNLRHFYLAREGINFGQKDLKNKINQ